VNYPFKLWCYVQICIDWEEQWIITTVKWWSLKLDSEKVFFLSVNAKKCYINRWGTKKHIFRYTTSCMPPPLLPSPERNSLLVFTEIQRMWGQTADQREGEGEKKSVRDRETGGIICWWGCGGSPVLTSTACYSFLSRSVCLSATPWIMQEWYFVRGIQILIQI